MQRFLGTYLPLVVGTSELIPSSNDKKSNVWYVFIFKKLSLSVCVTSLRTCPWVIENAHRSLCHINIISTKLEKYLSTFPTFTLLQMHDFFFFLPAPWSGKLGTIESCSRNRTFIVTWFFWTEHLRRPENELSDFSPQPGQSKEFGRCW